MAIDRAGASQGSRLRSPRDEVVRQYDEVRYPSLAHRQTDPDRLATIARLHGVRAPAVDGCRVLEIGCAGGGNLAAQAMALPNARFVGVDVSESQVEQGRAAIAAAGIGNVELCTLDLMDVGRSLGTFDYIVAHGLYSWISPDAQDELLATFARCLSPDGIASVSYNVRPGWHQLSVLRDELLFELRGIDDVSEKLGRARAYLAWLRDSLPDGGAFGPRFIEEVTSLERLDDWGLLHEYLGPYNAPIHFHKLVARATRRGLAYLCDAEPALSADHSVLPEAEQARRKSPEELVFAEQYYDFLANRRFRRSLFCRRGVPISRVIDDRLVDGMFVSSRASLSKGALSDVRGVAPMTFRSAESGLTTRQPTMKAALLHLESCWPRALAFPELLEAVRARVGPSTDPERDTGQLRRDLVEAFLGAIGILTLRTHAPPCVREPGDRPVASAWARQLVKETNRVASLDQDMVLLDDVLRRLLPLLDGTRDRAALEVELEAMFERGEVEVLLPDGRPGKPAPGAMDAALRNLARSALLVG